MTTSPTIIFFGGEPLGSPALQALVQAGLPPVLVVTNPDRPVGRKQVLTPPPVKVAAKDAGLPVWQPDTLRSNEAREKLRSYKADVFVVVAYNHILPKEILSLPTHGALNLHPSLLPKYRGPSPIRTQLLQDDSNVGVSVMLLDEKMDHGPLLAQEVLTINNTDWPLPGHELDSLLAKSGAALLANTLSSWLAGEITPTAQPHEEATYTHKFSKQDGELIIDPTHLPKGEEARKIFCKIMAFSPAPGTFFTYNEKRVKVHDATLENGTLVIHEVTPEGKKRQSFSDYLKTL